MEVRRRQTVPRSSAAGAAVHSISDLPTRRSALKNLRGDSRHSSASTTGPPRKAHLVPNGNNRHETIFSTTYPRPLRDSTRCASRVHRLEGEPTNAGGVGLERLRMCGRWGRVPGEGNCISLRSQILVGPLVGPLAVEAASY